MIGAALTCLDHEAERNLRRVASAGRVREMPLLIQHGVHILYEATYPRGTLRDDMMTFFDKSPCFTVCCSTSVAHCTRRGPIF